MRLITLLKSKLHRATVTSAELHYEGSLTVSADLAEKAAMREYERILVGNMGNGERFETYLILGESGKGIVQLNGATAHLGKPGDRLTIMSFAEVPENEAKGHRPTVLRLDEKNSVVSFEGPGYE